MWNTSQRRVNKSSLTWWHVWKTSWRYLYKKSWRFFEDVLKTSWRSLGKTSWRCLEDLLETSSGDEDERRLQDVFKMSSSRLMFAEFAPFLASLFMGHCKKEWLSNYYAGSPCYYTRYVDDIVSVFNSNNEVKRFFFYLDSRHPTIKFTMETKSNKVFPFFDVLIGNHNNILDTTTYHKS